MAFFVPVWLECPSGKCKTIAVISPAFLAGLPILLAIARVSALFVRSVEDIYESTSSFMENFWHPDNAMSAMYGQYLASFKRCILIKSDLGS